jgi:hypothetical protein
VEFRITTTKVSRTGEVQIELNKPIIVPPIVTKLLIDKQNLKELEESQVSDTPSRML